MFGPANVFVSHAWMYMFLDDLVGAIDVWNLDQSATVLSSGRMVVLD